MDRCPTCTIMTKNGPVDINLTDYDAEKHTLAIVGQPAPLTASEPLAVPEKSFSVGKNGKRGAASKFVIFDEHGVQFGTEEFATEEAALAAIGK